MKLTNFYPENKVNINNVFWVKRLDPRKNPSSEFLALEPSFLLTSICMILDWYRELELDPIKRLSCKFTDLSILFNFSDSGHVHRTGFGWTSDWIQQKVHHANFQIFNDQFCFLVSLDFDFLILDTQSRRFNELPSISSYPRHNLEYPNNSHIQKFFVSDILCESVRIAGYCYIGRLSSLFAFKKF